jgi:ubiquinone/menaquinone biosynthesis C-methylase UbiE
MDFSPLAKRYDELRPAGETWTELADLTLATLGPARRLLDVGCGTGRFAAHAAERLGARVWGVDPSPDMLLHARARRVRGAGWKLASAERLPFKDGWFDAVHAHLVLHLVDDLPAALTEMARVLAPGGRCAVVTFRPEHFQRFHLNAYFPSVRRIDEARFPPPVRIAEMLAASGLEQVEVRPVAQRLALDPAQVLDRVRGRYISTLHLIPDDEYRSGVERLERDVDGRRDPVSAELLWALVSAQRPAPR